MTEQEEREEFLNELRKSNTKLSKRSICALKAAWHELDQVKNEKTFLENQLGNATSELQKRGSR